MTKRYVTLRHAPASGRWCIEAPHATANVPQAYFIPGCALTFGTLSAAVKSLNAAGYAVVRNMKDKLRYVYTNGAPLIAA